MFKCNLESIGDCRDYDNLNREITNVMQMDDILQYQSVLDNDTESKSHGFPIYMMFEVFHVQRKTLNCMQEEKIEHSKTLRHLANLEI